MKRKLLKKLKGSIATFKIFEIEVDKTKFKEEMLELSDGVVILPLVSKNKIVLIKQYRFPIKKEIWELPAGRLEKDEEPKERAKKELEEETGFRVGKLEKIGKFYLSPGISSTSLFFFRATKLKPGKPKFEKGELIREIKPFSLKEVLRMIKTKKIVDMKTILSILLESFNRRVKI